MGTSSSGQKSRIGEEATGLGADCAAQKQPARRKTDATQEGDGGVSVYRWRKAPEFLPLTSLVLAGDKFCLPLFLKN